MDCEKLWDALIAEAKLDMAYQRGLQEVHQKEGAYLAVCEALSPEQKLAVEDYISACEELGDYMALIAYRLGKSKQSALKIL